MENSWMYLGTTVTIVLTLAYYSKQYFKPSSSTTTTPSLPSPPTTTASKPPTTTSDPSKYPGGKLTICFGSQTGTAEGFAQMLVDEGKDIGFDTEMVDLEDFDPEMFSTEGKVLFIMATYGEGEPTDNAVQFTEWIKEKHDALEPTTFAQTQFSVFGLGNRQYEHYNAMGQLVDKKLEKFGGTRMFDYGEGDDDGTLEEDFESWKEKLWPTLQSQFLGEMTPNASSTLHAPHVAFHCIPVEAGKESITAIGQQFHEDAMQNSNRHYFTAETAKIVAHREVRQNNEEGSTIHLEFDLNGTNISYVTADNLAILPENRPVVVELCAKLQGYKLDQWIKLESVESNHVKFPFPTPCSVRQLLTNFIDLGHAPRRNLLGHLAYFASDEGEKSRLLHLASKEGKDEYHQSIMEQCQTVVDILETFPSVRVPLDSFVHLMPSLQPRYYTISSSNQVHPNRIHVTVSIIRDDKFAKPFYGICSTYLSKLQPLTKDEKVKRPSRPGEQGQKKSRPWPCARVFVRPSSFRLPSDSNIPIIMIGPGTGLAPMRAFLQERRLQRQQGQSVGKTILYFGCRKEQSDFIYRDELLEYEKDGTLTELHTAFSRDSSQKVYVQHLMQLHGQSLWELLDKEQAHLYVCGATAMGNDVHKVLLNIVQQYGQYNETDASTYIKELQEKLRYIQELWSA